MKYRILFFLFFISGLMFGQNPVVLKIRLLQAEEGVQVHYQINQEDLVFIWQNVQKEIEVHLEDKLTIYVDNELVETIEISQNIIDRKRLNLIVTANEVLDELEIEYRNLNTDLGFEVNKTTRTERAVIKDNKLFDSESVSANVILDGLINKISGQAKLNNKALALEQEYQKCMRFLEVYSGDYLYENYKLPQNLAPFFALKMVEFINEDTKIDSPDFKELMEQQILYFKDNNLNQSDNQ